MSIVPGARLGPYEITATLGAGGMGQVFKARDGRLARDVAIKVLPEHLASDRTLRERLRREAIAAAQLDHPFICKVIEVADLDGHLFVVMELVVGETLHSRLRGKEPVTLVEAVAWTIEMAEALEAAHDRHIVHRDLKPSNVMVSSQGHVKVMDFGLAKSLAHDADAATRTVQGGLEGPLTGRGVRVGTPGYMSPEQIVGDSLDFRSDIFSLGVVLCELVGGAHPFRRPTVAATTTAILRSDPVIAPAVPGTEIPAALRLVIQRMLAKSPGERYQSMREVRRDLQGLASGGGTPHAWTSLGGARWASSDRVGQTRRWPMVGREAERAELTERLDAAIHGRGSLVLLGGEPGIGKTRLTEAILDAGRARSCMALVGHAYEMEGMQPYTPFIEMLEYSARVAPAAALRHALGDSAAEVSKLFPELRKIFPDVPPPLDVPPEQQRRLLFNAYRDFVERSCRMAPIVCVLEDLHWGDDASLQLLMHLAPALTEWPLLIVGTYRDVELDVTRPFARVLETLVRQRQASRIALRRLPADDVKALLAAMSQGQEPPASLSRVIFDETEGNPFFVEEVFQHLREEGRLFDADGKWRHDLRVDTLEVPEGVRLVIGRRLERLPEAARKVLTTAAVIGRSFSLPLLEALDGPGGGDAVLDAVEEAERAHLISPQRGGREARYLFNHELIRQTLADGLSMPRRQRLHGRIADAMERVYASALSTQSSALAHHLYQAGAAADSDRTTRALIDAAEQSRVACAAEECLRFIDQALSLWEGERNARTADLFERRALALRSLGRISEAYESFTRAIETWDAATDADRLVRTTVELGMTYTWDARGRSAADAADKVLARLEGATEIQTCPLRLMQAVFLAGAGDVELAMETWERADATRRAVTSPTLDQFARSAEPHLRWIICDLERASALARERVQEADAAGSPWQAIDIAWIDPLSEYFFGRPPSVQGIQDLRDKARRIGQNSVAGTMGLLLSYLAMHAGDLAGAERMVRETAAFNTSVWNRWGFFSPLFAAILAHLQGRTAQAAAELGQAESTEPETYWLGVCRRVRIWQLAQISPVDAGALLADTPMPIPVPGRVNTFGSWMSLSTYTPTLIWLNRRDDAAALLPACEALVATGLYTLSWTATAPTLVGMAAGCARDWDKAEAHFRDALARAVVMPSRTEPILVRRWHADMLIQRGRAEDRERARTMLGESESMADAIGMVFSAQQARDLRLTLG